MPRESRTRRAQRAGEIIARLRLAYPDAHCELDHRNPFELLVATILSAQCSDRQVNLATPALFRRCPDAQAMATAPVAEIETCIRQLGLFRSKARNLQACARALVEHHQGAVPSTLEDLTALAGVGRKTANVVLGNAFGRNEGIVVDTHVTRLAGRLGLSAARDPVAIERDLLPLVPRADLTLFSHLLIWHGRRRCGARRPDCTQCEIRDLCPSAPHAG